MALDKSKPLILLNLYLDQDGGGTQNLARKDITFHEVDFTGRVLSFGIVDRGVANPPGMLTIDDAEVEIEDVDGQIREWFSLVTPFKRIGEIVIDFEGNDNQLSDRQLPVPGWEQSFTSNSNLNDPYWTPLFTGEVIPGGVKFSPGKVTIRLREVATLWLNREIPKLIIRDNFPNLPDDANEGATDYTAPIIFGIMQSYTQTNVEPQGVIKCHLIDTKNNYYCVARHECAQVYSVYRRRQNDARFKIVSNTEYEVITVHYTINGVNYPFTIIHFFKQQDDGTFIQAEVNGIPYRFDFDTHLQITGITQRNPIYSLMNLIYYLVQTEVNPQRFSGDLWKAAAAVADEKLLYMDGAITDTMTVGAAISKICQDFLIDFFQTNQDVMGVSFYDPAGTGVTVPVDSTNLVLKNSFAPMMPEEIFVRIRYRYAKDNAGLIEFVKASETGHYGFEETVVNLSDKAELEATGKSADSLEKVINLDFIRDDDTALDRIKNLMGYYTLRSYPVVCDLPLPEILGSLNVGTTLKVSHVQGIGPKGVGWANLVMKTYQLTMDLKTLRATIKAIRARDPLDLDLQASFVGSHGTPHDPQRRVPPLPVTINGTLDPDLSGYVYHDAIPPLDINSTDPPLPDSPAEVPSTFGLAFTDGTVVTSPSNKAGIVPVLWQEDPTAKPFRKASAYVMIPEFLQQLKLYVGTLSPDNRPVLTDAEINRVIYYSADFDHLYLYVGTGETGTPSGWRAIDQTCGNVTWRWFAPVAPGWHVLDGSTVPMSDYKGDVANYTLPTMPAGPDVLVEVGSVARDDLTTVELTDNTSLPSCLDASAKSFDRMRFLAYMRL